MPSEVAKTPRNALWHLLSGDRELVRYGMEHYQARDAGLYNILNDLRQSYAMEGFEVPYTKEDYKREVARELFFKAPPADRRDWLDQLPAEERLGRLSPDERLSGLSPDERLSGLSPEQIEAYFGQAPQAGWIRRRETGGDVTDAYLLLTPLSATGVNLLGAARLTLSAVPEVRTSSASL